MTRTQAAIAVAALCALAAQPAAAHRQHQTTTTVAWNPRTATLEVTHRFHAHDALAAVTERTGEQVHGLDDVQTRAHLALYTAARFSLSTGDGESIELETLGAERDGQEVLVYQQSKLEEPPAALRIRCSVLHDVYPDQLNLVHIDMLDRPVRSLRFTREQATGKYRHNQ